MMPMYLRIYERVRILRYIALLPIGVILALIFGHPIALLLCGILFAIAAIPLPYMLDSDLPDSRKSVDTFRVRLWHRSIVPIIAIFQSCIGYASIRFRFDLYDTPIPTPAMFDMMSAVIWSQAAIFAIHAMILLEQTRTHTKGTMK